MNRVAHDGVTIQYWQIDDVSLQLVLQYGQVYKQLPRTIGYLHEGEVLPPITIAKFYHSNDQSPAELHLLSVARNAKLVVSTPKIDDCTHIREISNGNFAQLTLTSIDDVPLSVLCFSVITN